MRIRLGTFKEVSDVLKNIVEVIAIIAAGVWAYTKFVETEQPSLEFRGHVKSELTWIHPSDPSYCIAQLKVALKNIGKKDFDVTSVKLRVWLTPLPSLTSEMVEYVDPTRFQEGAPILEREMKSSGLLGHYGPEVESNYDYVFMVRRQPRLAAVRLDIQATGGVITESRWDDLCGIPRTELTKQPIDK